MDAITLKAPPSVQHILTKHEPTCSGKQPIKWACPTIGCSMAFLCLLDLARHKKVLQPNHDPFPPPECFAPSASAPSSVVATPQPPSRRQRPGSLPKNRGQHRRDMASQLLDPLAKLEVRHQFGITRTSRNEGPEFASKFNSTVPTVDDGQLGTPSLFHPRCP